MFLVGVILIGERGIAKTIERAFPLQCQLPFCSQDVVFVTVLPETQSVFKLTSARMKLVSVSSLYIAIFF